MIRPGDGPTAIPLINAQRPRRLAPTGLQNNLIWKRHPLLDRAAANVHNGGNACVFLCRGQSRWVMAWLAVDLLWVGRPVPDGGADEPQRSTRVVSDQAGQPVVGQLRFRAPGGLDRAGHLPHVGAAGQRGPPSSGARPEHDPRMLAHAEGLVHEPACRGGR
jgi:hypothetical protein